MVDNAGNAHEEYAYYCPNLRGVNLISPAAIIRRKKKDYVGYDIHYNYDDNAGSITFNGRRESNSYTLDCKISES